MADIELKPKYKKLTITLFVGEFGTHNADAATRNDATQLPRRLVSRQRCELGFTVCKMFNKI